MVRIQKNLAPWTSKSYVCTFFLQQMHNDYDHDCYYCYCQGHIWKGSIFHVSISASGFTPPWFCPFSPPFTRPVTTTEPLGSWAEMVHRSRTSLKDPHLPNAAPYPSLAFIWIPLSSAVFLTDLMWEEESFPHFSAAVILFSRIPRDIGVSGDPANPSHPLVSIMWTR